MATKDMFCGVCNETKPFTLSVNGRGEYTAVCSVCAHTYKFPGGCDLRSLILEHNADNVPRVLVDDNGDLLISQEQQDAIDAALAP